MKASRRFCPQVEALEARFVPSASRPISDFLSAQGTTSLFPNGPNPGGPAGLPDELGWTTSSSSFANGTARFARVDYTGQDAAFLGLHLGTTTSGTISERTLPDGAAQDIINLHTKNAFAWAVFLGDGSNPNPPVIFGYLPSQLAANPALMPPLVNVDLHFVIDIPAPGAPLPDIVALANFGLAGYSLETGNFRAEGSGITPSGQQANLVVSETGLTSQSPKHDGGFTAEVVDVHIQGPQNTGTGGVSASASLGASASASLTTMGTGQSSSAAVDVAFVTGLETPLI
jgi:hypothetical protein